MSSSTPWTPVKVEDLPVEGEGAANWQSPRQRTLERLYRHFNCTYYEDRKCDWDGTPSAEPEEHDGIARTGVLPAGFEMADETAVPLKYRKPCAPVSLGRAVPLKLSAMLFGAKKHPKMSSDDPRTEDWLSGYAEVTRLWSKWKQARNLGGAMGAVGVGFKFVEGRPVVEVHDPRWCTPLFEDRSECLVKALEKRYRYSEQVMTEEGWVTQWYWYRRVITDQMDVVWPKVLVEEGEEPQWVAERYDAATHGYGFCPVVWVQNQPVEEDVDGAEDLHGTWYLVESIDMLNSQARYGTIASCDPTDVISSDAQFDAIKRGSSNAIQVEKGGSVTKLEMTGSGIKAARELRDDMLEQLCTIARVALDRNEGGPSRTVEEVEHVYSSMLENCDELREQYGELGVKRLLEMVLVAARQLSGTKVEEDPATGMKKIVRSAIRLPKRRVQDPDTGRVSWQARELGEGSQIELRWPKYYQPSAADVVAAVNAAGTAKTFGLIDQRHASEYVAEDFQVEDVTDMIKKVAAEQKAAAGGGMGGDDSLSDTVAERTLAGANSPLPNPAAKQLSAVARQASR